MKVKVLGTSFNVKSYVDEPGVYTTLVEGSVAILRDGNRRRRSNRENKLIIIRVSEP